ncbi:DNA repair protein SWI5 homolog [Cotesia typhae]|uniref:DNA repair protein SWI5 homolog n=1 Tax=Cotesia typhae TaxID=2053667 RepID=UPI003D69D743
MDSKRNSEAGLVKKSDKKNCKSDKLSTVDKEEYERLKKAEEELEQELNKLKQELEAGPSMKETIDDLHEYNDIKDATQVVLGAMATMNGVTIASLHQEYDLPCKDD